MEKEKEQIQLPDNAFTELKPGEEYKPIMSPGQTYPEVNMWSVTWGIIMAMLFSAAAAYLGLKVGQVFEAAIPIAIIAVGVSTAAKRNKALGENVIIQSIGACSGTIVAGAIFTLPAIYILQAKYPEMSVSFFKVFFSSLLGGILGILFMIPFRKYFVKDMHGKYPFPEATATTQVLVSGEKGGSQAKPLLVAGLVGGLYDFIVATVGWWNENFTTRVMDWGVMAADKAKLVFKVNTGAAVFGLGYIIGLKYAFIICLGSFAVWWLIVPGMSIAFHNEVLNIWNPEITQTVGAMSPEEIFKYYGKSIGIGGIAMAGIIGIIKSWGIIKGAVSLAANEMKGGSKASADTVRTQRDISFKIIAIGSIVTLIATFLFFWFGVMEGNLLFAVVGILLVAVIAFLFTTVAANAIAIVGSNPVSGMTLMTLILASVVLVAVGLKGTGGMGSAHHGWRCMYSAVDGRRFHHRFEDWLLARNDSRQAGDMEVPRHTRFGCYRRWRYDSAQPDLRICKRTACRSSSQRYGCRNRPVDERCRCSVGVVCSRCCHCHCAHILQDSCHCVCTWYVHPARTEHSAPRGRYHQLVCIYTFEER